MRSQAGVPKQAWTVAETASALAISERTISEWVRRGPARASIAPARGRRATVLLSLNDVLEICVISELRRAGLPLQKIATLLDRLRAASLPLNDFYALVVRGEDLLGYRTEEALTASLLQGQGRLILVPIVNFFRVLQEAAARPAADAAATATDEVVLARIA